MTEKTITHEAKITLVTTKNKKGATNKAGNITIRNQTLLPYAGRTAKITIVVSDVLEGDGEPTPAQPPKAEEKASQTTAETANQDEYKEPTGDQ